MDQFVDLRWVERAACRLQAQNALLDASDALEMARSLALQPAWQVCEPEAMVDRQFGHEREPAANQAPATASASR